MKIDLKCCLQNGIHFVEYLLQCVKSHQIWIWFRASNICHHHLKNIPDTTRFNDWSSSRPIPNFDIVFRSIIYHGQPYIISELCDDPDTRNLYAYRGNLLPLMALTLW